MVNMNMIKNKIFKKLHLKPRKHTSLKSMLVLIYVLFFLSTMTLLLLFLDHFKTLDEYKQNLYNVGADSFKIKTDENVSKLLTTMNTLALNQTIRSNIFRQDVDSREMLIIGDEMRKIINSTTYLLYPNSQIYTHKFFTYLPGDGYNFWPQDTIRSQLWYDAFSQAQAFPFYTFTYSSITSSFQLNIIQSINDFSTYGVSKVTNAICYEALTVDIQNLLPERASIFQNGKSEVFLIQGSDNRVLYATSQRLQESAIDFFREIKSNELSRPDEDFKIFPPEVEFVPIFRKLEKMDVYIIFLFEPIAENPQNIRPELVPIYFIAAIFLLLLITLLRYYFNYRKSIFTLIHR